jgi:DTW domain-containing protein YfiP
MHPKEAKKERVGTGRFTQLSLRNSQIIVGDKFDECSLVYDLIQNPNHNCFLLYPGSQSIRINETLPNNFEESQKKNIIFIIDATWPCAKTLMRESLILHSLPRISFQLTSEIESKFDIKQQPSKECLSTCESTYWLLEFLSLQGVENLKERQHENLLYLLEKTCEFQKQCALNPELQRYRPGVFKQQTQKKPSLRWQTRKIYFE